VDVLAHLVEVEELVPDLAAGLDLGLDQALVDVCQELFLGLASAEQV
jgi:hypothetical protein